MDDLNAIPTQVPAVGDWNTIGTNLLITGVMVFLWHRYNATCYFDLTEYVYLFLFRSFRNTPELIKAVLSSCWGEQTLFEMIVFFSARYSSLLFHIFIGTPMIPVHVGIVSPAPAVSSL